jgi:hypothetical protein
MPLARPVRPTAISAWGNGTKEAVGWGDVVSGALEDEDDPTGGTPVSASSCKCDNDGFLGLWVVASSAEITTGVSMGIVCSSDLRGRGSPIIL